ncbi:MAG: RNA polymerase sigma-54 factor [Gemmatimonadetes bacterium]|nr:MAG: RNA polymerase sigma-54 factor [Gemmatimonadota bacterium]
MELRTGLQLKQTQKLVMTPKLQQALKILQVPTLQLEQMIRQELMENPLLEEIEETEEELDEKAQEEQEDTIDEELNLDTEKEREETAEPVEDTNIDSQIDEILGDPYESDYMVRDYSKNDEEPYRPEPGTRTNLHEHLRRQLHIRASSQKMQDIGEYIIGNLDDYGYLMASVEELAEELGETVENVQIALQMIQTFDPLGVGARDIRECLLIQVRARELEFEDDIAEQIIDKHWDDFIHKRYPQIAKRLGLSSPKDVERYAQAIAKLNPKPGLAFSSGVGSEHVTPDLIVDRVGDDYVVYVNDRNIPRLRVSRAYRSILRDKNGSEKTKEYVADKLSSAKWLIKTIDQRRKTMVRTMECIVESQREFFDHGISKLKPMNLLEVAEKIGVHESTVSRVTNGKYVQTPHGVFELKYFFDSGLGTDSGEDVSATTAKNIIKELIAKENPRKPLSDKKIAQEMQKRGINIARRTVAKYREQLKILPSRMRKSYE